MKVVVLEDAAADLEAGRIFYDRREAGVGDYFVESLLSDLSLSALYAGINKRHFGLSSGCASAFRSASFHNPH